MIGQATCSVLFEARKTHLRYIYTTDTISIRRVKILL